MISALLHARMSKLDPFWNERQTAEASKEGWQLAWVVDEGKSIANARLDIFDDGPRFPHRTAAMKFVIQMAQTQRSRLHLDALSACSASRVPMPMKKSKGKK